MSHASHLAPPVLERATRRVVIAMFAVCATACLAASLAPGPWDALLFTLAMIAFMGVTGWQAVLWHQSRTYVRTHRFLLCRGCGYPLDGLAPEGRCPECGEDYRHDEVRAYWIDRIQPHDPIRPQ